MSREVIITIVLWLCAIIALFISISLAWLRLRWEKQ